MYVLAVRGTSIKALVREALRIADILSNEPYRNCFYYSVYIVIKDKPDKCWESEKMVKQLEERPMIVLINEKKLLKELGRSVADKLREKGRIYHRPRLIHYVALWLSDKKRFGELTREDVDKAKKHVLEWLEPYIDLPMYRIHKLFLQQYRGMYQKYPHAPKSYQSVARLIRNDLGLGSTVGSAGSVASVVSDRVSPR